MTRTWAKRIQRLESILQSSGGPSAVFRYGYVRYLPQGTGGERHMAIVKSKLTALADVEQCEFEERMGPAPEAHQDLTFAVYLSVEDQRGNSR
jgi:hypothetical protein